MQRSAKGGGVPARRDAYGQPDGNRPDRTGETRSGYKNRALGSRVEDGPHGQGLGHSSEDVFGQREGWFGLASQICISSDVRMCYMHAAPWSVACGADSIPSACAALPAASPYHLKLLTFAKLKTQYPKTLSPKPQAPGTGLPRRGFCRP